ncbi:MAG TPA: SNF2-related protein [Planctomycetaceae bacterium]|nr:SNF2-related protein [Planctomycetaceae bacterium]HQZ63461.1 SNF2-related protein [Planctomycetaceae bacterium]
MSLATQEKSVFGSGVRSRGQDYFASRFVTILERDSDQAVAVVKNDHGGTYDVVIVFDGKTTNIIDTDCSCPYFAGAGQCKHLWATILQLDSDEKKTARQARLPAPQTDIRQTSGQSSQQHQSSQQQARQPDWMTELRRLGSESTGSIDAHTPASTGELILQSQQFWYVIDISRSVDKDSVTIDLMTQQFRASGALGSIKEFRLDRNTLDALKDPVHAPLMQQLLSITTSNLPAYSYSYYSQPSVATVEIKPMFQPALLPQLAKTGRLCWRLSAQVPLEDVKFLTWQDDAVWEPVIDFVQKPAQQEWIITGRMIQNTFIASNSIGAMQQTRPIADMMLMTSAGLAVFPESLAAVRPGDKEGWVRLLQRKPELRVSFDDHQLFLKQVLKTPALLRMPLPADFCPHRQNVTCKPRLRLLAADKLPQMLRQMRYTFGVIDFLYDDVAVSIRNQHGAIWNDMEAQAFWRDFSVEADHLRSITELGGQSLPSHFRAPDIDVQFVSSQTVNVIHKLMALGWEVEAEGAIIKQPGSFRIGVTSGLDWFELNADMDFDGVTAALPTLLQALKSGAYFVTLSDGSRGMLPEEWLRRYGTIASFGEVDGDTIRFKPSQAMILDALLDAQENVTRDRGFKAYCKKLKDFTGIKTRSAPKSFQGELRDYQKDGLSWLHFLNDFRLGGCLADDMGLGKTIQVLSLLEARRTRRLKSGETRRPSLVVVPKSLIFNWSNEATRFTPKLKIVNYTGLQRRDHDLADVDIILTTYGTLRKDIVDLQATQFDYIVLDEAQAIKNSGSQAAKACRLLKADHRLAMTGTPVENHLGELWSLFEFLNPGMLGASSAFQKLTAASNNEDDKAAALNTLSKALRPFMLRRTKQQVLTELPGKTEQTLYCEMPPKQRKLYNELRDYYRVQLSSKIKELGLKRSKIHVLEALLRLRQAACHQGLIDSKRQNEDSAKLDTLLEQLTQIAEDGHKALVFSQFTSLLAIVKKKLDKVGIRYEYLDGKSNKRQEIVSRFQTDEKCPLFLISLKAGGHGLNLTAADYVFILDPWWNPAVEAQAVDRAHRIGQDRHVFAYRLICKDTVEERILEMQKDKQQLAESIISADASLIRSLSSEDLSLLLS